MCALVTGVQTCALPISAAGRYSGAGPDLDGAGRVQHGRRPPDRRARADRKARRQSEPLARCAPHLAAAVAERSEEHTSELQSLMRISYAVFCLNTKKLLESTTNSTNKLSKQ